jgi:hypothetical protein
LYFFVVVCVVVRFKNLSEETRSFPKPEVHSVSTVSLELTIYMSD